MSAENPTFDDQDLPELIVEEIDEETVLQMSEGELAQFNAFATVMTAALEMKKKGVNTEDEQELTELYDVMFNLFNTLTELLLVGKYISVTDILTGEQINCWDNEYPHLAEKELFASLQPFQDRSKLM